VPGAQIDDIRIANSTFSSITLNNVSIISGQSRPRQFSPAVRALG
jgi:hypothetical protein